MLNLFVMLRPILDKIDELSQIGITLNNFLHIGLHYKNHGIYCYNSPIPEQLVIEIPI